MGQAKKRGTYKERVEQAKLRPTDQLMEEIGSNIHDILNSVHTTPIGFCLVVFEAEAPGSVNYIGNVDIPLAEGEA